MCALQFLYWQGATKEVKTYSSTALEVILPREILLCENCDAGFHAKCNGEIISRESESAWVCSACIAEKHQSLPDPPAPDLTSPASKSIKISYLLWHLPRIYYYW